MSGPQSLPRNYRKMQTDGDQYTGQKKIIQWMCGILQWRVNPMYHVLFRQQETVQDYMVQGSTMVYIQSTPMVPLVQVFLSTVNTTRTVYGR